MMSFATHASDKIAAQPPQAGTLAQGEAVGFEGLPGWAAENHSELLAVFRRSCEAVPALRAGMPRPAELAGICRELLSAGTGSSTAREYFEARFQPWRIVPTEGQGFLTGYFEPEFPGSLTRTDAFPTPLYARPPDLVTRMPGDAWPEVDPALTSARQTAGGLQPYPDRNEIDNGALTGQDLEIIWLQDPVDRFVMQVQGSARIRLEDGTIRRLAYSGRNGHAYTSLGKLLVNETGVAPELMTMDRLVAHLKSDPDEARWLIAKNRSFVFFRLADELAPGLGPIGGEGVPLTPFRSVAADRGIWPYGTPVMLSGSLPLAAGGTEPLARAAIVQDTGSAILGPARVDLFFGSGAEAGHRAGLTRHSLTLHVLWPKSAGNPLKPANFQPAGSHAPPQ